MSRYSLAILSTMLSMALMAPIPESLEEDFEIPSLSMKPETDEERFTRLDVDRNQRLTFDEFLHMDLAYATAKKEEFDMLDSDSDGIISQKEYQEHYKTVQTQSDKLRQEYFAGVFEDFDTDFDMQLSKDELVNVLAERFLVKPRGNFPKIVDDFDKDHSGGLDLNEYMEFDRRFPFDQTDAIKFSQPTQQPKENAFKSPFMKQTKDEQQAIF